MSAIQSVEDVAAMEFGGGLGKLIPDDQNLSKAWLAQYSAYQREQGAYPAMSAGSASIQSPSTVQFRSPMEATQRLGQNAGMSMGQVRSMLPSLQQSGQTPGSGGFGWGRSGRPGQESADWISRSAESAKIADAQREEMLARMQQAGDTRSVRVRPSGSGSTQKQQPQQWFSPEQKNRTENERIRDRQAMTPEKTRATFADLMGGRRPPPQISGYDQDVIGGPNPGTWKGALVVGGAIVLVGILLVNLGKR